MLQTIFRSSDPGLKIGEILREIRCQKFLLVCGGSFRRSPLMEELLKLNVPCSVFSGFTPNPTYEEVCAGLEQFQTEGCNVIIAAGGGSAIDVAKCIKLFSPLDPSCHFLKQEWSDSGVPLIAVPTTAGTGSESTRFAVIYDQGVKQSVQHPSILPNYAVLDSRFLKTLPQYQKKCTMMDAFCQAIESWWSVHSTDESKGYAKQAVELIVKYGDRYIFENTDEAAEQIMLASNLAGQAINVTSTTAPHAMSYKLTSLYGFPHGYSVALSLPRVWEYMQKNLDRCLDVRGEEYVSDVFSQIAKAMGADTPQQAVALFDGMLEKYELFCPKSAEKSADVQLLVSSVNLDRLKNNPVELPYQALCDLYDSIVKEGDRV